MSLDWQELPNDYLNLTTRRPYTVEETRDLINQRLLTRGYTILEQEEGLTIIKIEKLNPAQVPRVQPEELESRMAHEFAKCSFDMKWLIATEVVKELDTLKSPQGKLIPMPGANRIEAMDTVINLREIYDAIQEQQSPERRKLLAREFVLDHTRADIVAGELREFLGLSSSSSTSSRSPVSTQQMQQMQKAMMQQMQRAAQSRASAGAAKTIAAKKVDVKVVANTRRNSIVVHAGPDKLAIVEEFIALVDVHSEQLSLDAYTTRMQVFRLASLDSEKLMDSLNSLGGLEPQTKLTVDSDNNALIVYGSLADQVLIKSVIDRLDGSGRKSEVIQLRRLPADQVAGSVTFLMGVEEDEKNNNDYYNGWYSSRSRSKKKTDKFKVTANLEYNQLLVWANDIELREVYNLLEKLGEISTEGSGGRVRVINAGDPLEMRTFLRRLEKLWPSENELILPDESDLPKPLPPAKAKDDDAGEDSSDSTKKPSPLLYDDNATTQFGPPTRADFVSAASSPEETDEQDKLKTEVAKPPVAPQRSETDAAPDAKKQAGGQAENQDAIEDAQNLQLLQRLEALRRLRAEGQQAPMSEQSAESPARLDAKKKSPVRISVNANGELVFTSDDNEALALVEQLAENLATPQKKFEVFHLEHASAFWVKFNLEDFFEEDDGSDNEWMSWMFGVPPRGKDKSMQLGKRRVPRFIDDLDTNTILVQGATAEQLRTIGDLIELYDVKEPVTAANSRFTKVFYIKHSKPSLIEATIKEALRDLLSSNDKALQQPRQSGNGNPRGGQQQPQRSSFTTKGKLSIGSDDISRVMIVSCEGENLMEIVTKMIDTLDLAAKPAAAVDVVKIGGGINLEGVRKALRSFETIGQQPGARPATNPQQPRNVPNVKSQPQPALGGVIISNQ